MGDTLRAEFAKALPAAIIEQVSTDAPGFNPPGTFGLSIRMRPQAGVQVLLCGHYDTVFAADDAFQTCRWLDETTLNGPGVIDMKGGLVTMLAAVQAFEQTPHATQIGWEILLTPDEETGSHGSRALLKAAAQRNHFGLVFEPARPSGDIVHSRKGTGSFVATCHGRAAHAAKVPNDGRNAVLALAEFLLEVGKIPEELPGVLVTVANIRGGTAATNIVPHFAQSEIDVRITKVSDQALLLARFEALAARVNARDGFKLELQARFNRPPKEYLPIESAVLVEWQSANRDLGLPAFTSVHTGGASDGNFLSEAGLPNLDGLGPLGDQLHSEREFCRIETIAPRAQIVALFLHRVAVGEISLPKK